MKQKVIKTGNSVAVTVPASFVQAVGVKIGDDVQVKTDIKTGRVIYSFTGVQQLSLDDQVAKNSKKT